MKVKWYRVSNSLILFRLNKMGLAVLKNWQSPLHPALLHIQYFDIFFLSFALFTSVALKTFLLCQQNQAGTH